MLFLFLKGYIILHKYPLLYILRVGYYVILGIL